MLRDTGFVKVIAHIPIKTMAIHNFFHVYLDAQYV